MRVRRPALIATIALGIVGLTPVAAPLTASSAPADDRPNIVLITTDDQTLSDMRYMPLTRRLLGESGVTFRDMLSPHPLCCPARAQILTGQYAQNNGVRSNSRHRHGGYTFLDNQHTIATWLRDAGYGTAFVGKYLNEYRAPVSRPEPGWQIWNPTIRNIYGYYDYTMYNDGAPRDYAHVHNADLVGQKTVDYIERLAANDKPFFLWSSHVAPHAAPCVRSRPGRCPGPPRAADRHRDLFQGVSSPSLRSRAFNEKDVSDKPPEIRRLPKVKRGEINRLFRGRIRSLQAVDEAVRSAVRALEGTGELDNTLILFTTDNGYLLGEHRDTKKDVPYEQALHTPLLMRGPGVPAGVDRRRTVTLVDLAPTIVAAAEATATLVMDGRSILPVARGVGAGHETVLILAGARNAREMKAGWGFRGVRTSRYSYAWYPNRRFAELYDRKRDPAQLRNVAGHRKYREVQRELVKRMKRLKSCSGAGCNKRFGPI